MIDVKEAEYAAWLDSQLLKYNLKNIDFAKKVGVAPETVSVWLSGKRQPTPRNLRRINDYFSELAKNVSSIQGKHGIKAEFGV